MTAAEYQNMIVSYRNGAPVQLSQLGNIVDGVEDERTASWFYTPDDQQRAITLGIQRQPGTNTIAVADAVKNLLPATSSLRLPPGGNGKGGKALEVETWLSRPASAARLLPTISSPS